MYFKNIYYNFSLDPTQGKKFKILKNVRVQWLPDGSPLVWPVPSMRVPKTAAAAGAASSKPACCLA